MDAVLVDSNVLLDVATNDAAWGDWSAEALERTADEAILVINPLVYAEVSVGFDAIEDLEAALSDRSLSPRGAPIRGRIPGRQVLPAVSTSRRTQTFTAA